MDVPQVMQLDSRPLVEAPEKHEPQLRAPNISIPHACDTMPA